jgi:hypothetical protein
MKASGSISPLLTPAVAVHVTVLPQPPGGVPSQVKLTLKG